MKEFFLRAVFGAFALTSFSAHAQMHKVAKPEQVVRAIGVYEWTGDLTKPKASRLIPVSIFIDGKLEDAGVYVARPVPFALLTGNVYELQDAGIDKAMLDLAYARHLQAVDSTGDMAWDDGWFGYGSVKPLAAPRKTMLKPSKNLPVITSSRGSTAPADTSRPKLQTKTSTDTATSGADQSKTTAPDSGSGTSTASSSDPDRPTMKRRSDSGSSDAGTSGNTGSSSSGSTTASQSTTADSSVKSSGSASSSDPDRPTMKRRSDSTADTTSTSSTSSPAPADDPDRPTMKRRTDSSGTDTSSSGSTTAETAKSGGSTPADDPDRPTMKRRSSDSKSDSTPDSTTTASTTGSPTSNDPDRPTLKRHAPEDPKRKNGSDAGSVSGVGSLNDDPSRPTLHHGKPTSAMTETDLPKLVGLPSDLHQMVAVSDAANREPHEFALAWEDDAQRAAVLQKMQALARVQLASYGVKPAATAAAKPAVAAKKTSPPMAAKAHRPAAAPAAGLEPLLDEELKAYTLSYGGAATYIYTAHTGGTGAALRYVTIVVQADGLGDLKPAIQSVTDAAHLDRTPRMRFVDVVDAEASNRASLLFELRGQTSRQFGLYRVIAAHSEQTFLTGTTQ